MRVRARRVSNEILLPYVSNSSSEDVHVAVVSHGLFIRELIMAMLKDQKATAEGMYGGLHNTGWTNVVVTVDEVGF